MPVIVKPNSTQDYILEVLMPTDGLSVVDVVKSTGYSQSLVRQKLDILTARSEVIIDKTRQPYIYKVNPDSIASQQREIVERAKAELFNKDSENPLVRLVRELPKSMWVNYVQPMRALARALEELENDGKLIETLEDM